MVIEPGLIKTGFAEAAVGSMADDYRSTDPTRSSIARSARRPPGAYEGGLAKLGGGPEAVARKIEKAITAGARRPATR